MSAPGRSQALTPEREAKRDDQPARRATPGALIPQREARRVVT